MERLVSPIRRGEFDFVIASRARGEREAGAMSWYQLLSGHIAGLGIRMLYRDPLHTDMCAYRAIRRDCLERLNMREMTYGWNIEMQMKAARLGLRGARGPHAPIAAAARANPRSPDLSAGRCGPRFASSPPFSGSRRLAGDNGATLNRRRDRSATLTRFPRRAGNTCLSRRDRGSRRHRGR